MDGVKTGGLPNTRISSGETCLLAILPQNTKFIGGHGRDYTMADVKDYRKMLAETIKIVQKGMQDGKSVEDMKKGDVLKDYKSWGVFLDFLDTDYWIASIHDSYKSE